MAFEIINHGVVEAAAVVFGSGAGPAYSAGAQLDNPQYLAAAMFCVVSDGGDGLGDLDVDIVVQTAPEDAVSDADWMDTKTRINGIIAFGSYQILVTDPVLSNIRAKIVKNAGTEDVSFQFRWGADRTLSLL
jgi:hypothetical protein